MELSSPTFVASISNAPNWLTVPLDTVSPTVLPTGRDSPVMDRLIDRSLPRNYHAINRNALTGRYAYTVADFDLFCGDDFFLAFSQNSYGLRC